MPHSTALHSRTHTHPAHTCTRTSVAIFSITPQLSLLHSVRARTRSFLYCTPLAHAHTSRKHAHAHTRQASPLAFSRRRTQQARRSGLPPLAVARASLHSRRPSCRRADARATRRCLLGTLALGFKAKSPTCFWRLLPLAHLYCSSLLISKNIQLFVLFILQGHAYKLENKLVRVASQNVCSIRKQTCFGALLQETFLRFFVWGQW